MTRACAGEARREEAGFEVGFEVGIEVGFEVGIEVERCKVGCEAV